MQQSETFNTSKTINNQDFHFVIHCINIALRDEIAWPNAAERAQLTTRLPQFPGCVGIVDGTLCQIKSRTPVYYSGRKKIYCTNSMVVVEPVSGLVIAASVGFPGSYHDVRCFRHSSIHTKYLNMFAPINISLVIWDIAV